MPRGVYDRKKTKKKTTVKPKIIKGGHYDRVVMNDVIGTVKSTGEEPINKVWGQANIPDYHKMYNDLKNDLQYKRQETLTHWMQSVATINESISRAIGELGGGRL